MAIALDVSNVNPATLEQVKASGCKLLICKGTEGDWFVDHTIDHHRQIARQLGIRFGLYVFLHAKSKGNEARFFLDNAKPGRGELVFIDAESGGQDGTTVAEMAWRTGSCARALVREGRNPIVYASSSFWIEMVKTVPSLRNYRVWEAQYPGRFTRWFPRLARLRVRLFRRASVVLWQWTDAFESDGKRFDASRIMVRHL